MSLDKKKKKSMEYSSSCVPLMSLFLLGMLLSSPLASADFDFYYLVLMWPGTYCSQSKCCRPTTGPPPDDFIIRGLWPVNYTTESVVTKCGSEPFIKKELEELEYQLAWYWSNLKCPSNNGMSSWKSAWKTYGTCSNKAEKDYFELALNLRKEVDVLAALEKEGIIPRKGYPYNYINVLTAIKENIGVGAMIRCNSKDEIYEVYICMDKYGKSPIDCPFDLHFTCAPWIFLPEFDGNKLNKSETSFIKMPIDLY
ncbi:hypothetical protein J5N97_019231 [Dioscorea zingiberensis]|uniref:Uncharacterized protein n=1 Tax=Dioscorea zingiberensis TaxID=325984 RepID=A0A9D5CDH8_9LILI|nr:hypothetical protein J5N97_019231 [Dioscorea zingiberensis]